MKKRPHHIEYSKRIAELVEQYGIPAAGEPASLSPLWSALLGSGMGGLTWEDKEEICRTGKSPHLWEPRRDGRTGYAAKIKDDAIIIDEWSAGVKQKHMQIVIPLAQWPMKSGWEVATPPSPFFERPLGHRRSVNDLDVVNLAYVQCEICQRAIAEMAKRVFNEDPGPHMARQADAIRKAIYKVLPESATGGWKGKGK